MENIPFETFQHIAIKIGKIIKAARIETSAKLLMLTIDFGTEQRQIIAGIGKAYPPESLIGKECPFVVNLEPKVLAGLESQGMILCADRDGTPVLLHPEHEVPPGSPIK